EPAAGKVGDAAESCPRQLDPVAIGSLRRAVEQQHVRPFRGGGGRMGRSVDLGQLEPTPSRQPYLDLGAQQLHPEGAVLDPDHRYRSRFRAPGGLDRERAVLDRQPARNGQPVSFPKEGGGGGPGIGHTPDAGRGGTVEAVWHAVHYAGVACVGRDRLPSATIAVGPCFLVEVADQRRAMRKRRPTKVLGAGAHVDEVEDLASVSWVGAHQQLVGLQHDHSSSTTLPPSPEAAISTASLIRSSGSLWVTSGARSSVPDAASRASLGTWRAGFAPPRLEPRIVCSNWVAL